VIRPMRYITLPTGMAPPRILFNLAHRMGEAQRNPSIRK